MDPAETAPQEGARETAQASGKALKDNDLDGTRPSSADTQKSASEADATAKASATATTSENGVSSSASESSADGARAVAEKSDLYDFEYSYPAEAGKIPTLRSKLDDELDQEREALKSDALEARSDAKGRGFPYNAYSVNVNWEAVSDLPGWLSLSKLEWTYSGGAHGNSVFGSMLWDKNKDRMVAPVTLFESPMALTDAVREPFCEALNQQRAEKRGTPIVTDSEDIFTECIDPVESSALVPVSSNGRTFDRLTFLIPPYAAGPYAEGSYEVTLPVTQAVFDAVNPDYSAAFSKRR